jgi:peroxiredoxin Q/BCP
MTRLAPGDLAPDFTLTAHDGSTVALQELLATSGEHVVVYFYPAAMTPGCTTQACDFRDSLDALNASGYTVVGISKDSVAKLAQFADRDGITFPLLSDPDHAVLEAYGAWGEKTNYGRTSVGVVRSTVVVDPKGVVEVAQYNVRAKGHVAKLRKDLGLDD